jgi:hypothetical protein
MIDIIKQKYKDKKFIIFSIICLIMIICPFFTILKSDSQKLNYIYNDGHIADGVFVILFVVLIFLLNIFNLHKSSLIPLTFLSILLIMLFYNLASKDVIKYATFNFYLLYICLVGIIILCLMFIIKKKKQ